MKILHVATDEKFIDSISWQFDRLDNTKNWFILLLDSINEPIKYVTCKENFKIVPKDKKGLLFCIKEIEKHDIIIFHGLNYFQSQIVLKSNEKSKLLWFFWGGEFYDNPKFQKFNPLGTKTQELFINPTLKDKFKKAIRPSFYYLKNKTKIPEQSVLDAAKKIDYFGILYEEEMNYFKSHNYLSNKTSFFKMTYYPLEFIFKGIEHIKVNGQNILIGNSASLTNNHIEAFDFLKNANLEKRKLIVPLSYGDMNYAQSINKIGTSIFDEKMTPIFEFMPLDAFNILLGSCNVVIMNHYRQQAVGNIVAALWMGAKVYLNERNTLYQYLKRIGISVYSINQELTQNPTALEGLNEAEILHNRKILQNEIGFEGLKNSMSKALKSILENDY